ncbi:MAG: LapA family protein [Gemmatimonadetes bacterium]|nr:MAG: LapA family protein [Gemmatimonadota bacterium]
MWKLFLPLVLAVGFIIGSFIWLNGNDRIIIYFFQMQSPPISVGMALMLAFFAGVVVMYIWSTIAELNMRNQLRRIQKEKQALLREIERLSALPEAENGVGSD